jgi:DNA polymerase-1
LSRTTDLTLAEAEDFVKAYFEQFPGVKRYLEEIRLQVTEQGYVSTLAGRRRYFPQLSETATVSEVARARALREAINAPIQGTAADIIKVAMLKIPDKLESAGLSTKMLLQVHDELVFECPPEQLQSSAEIIQEYMRSAYKLDVPLKTDAKSGQNWAELEPYPS